MGWPKLRDLRKVVLNRAGLQELDETFYEPWTNIARQFRNCCALLGRGDVVMASTILII
jgi:hypothetical protein